MFAYFATVLSLTSIVLCDFYLKIIHSNDIHSRFDAERCSRDKNDRSMCGGIAKLISLIKSERNEQYSNFEKLVLNGGDMFQGSLWYIVGGWKICAELMNVMKPDVQCLGNHEFDKGLDELESYVTECKFPTIGGNVDFSKHPSLVDKIQKSIVISKGSQKIGIIGYVTREAAFTSRPGVAIFEEEITALTKESNRLKDQGVKIIIALGHSGEKIDKQIARKVPHVDIVVGSHDHILYYNSDNRKGPGGETIRGKYPTIEEREVDEKENNRQVPIVTAYAFSKYIGIIRLTFNDDGKLLDFRGRVERSTGEPDAEALQILKKYQPAKDELTTKKLGFLLVNLVCHNRRCRNYECNCGNLLVDAFVMYRAAHGPKKKWTDAPLGIMNAGSILLKGNFTEKYLTKGALLEIFPNQNQIVIIKLKGKHLKEALEHGVSYFEGTTSHLGEYLQVSGIRFEVRFLKKKGEVSSIKVRCGDCRVPKYTDLNPTSTYSIVTTEFLASGADGHKVIKDHTISTEYLNVYDEEVITWYFENYYPMYAERRNRIIVIKDKHQQSCEERLQPIMDSILLFVAFCSYYL